MPDIDPISAPARLAAVVASGLLDVPPDAALDRLTRRAALIVNAPFAFATIVDDVRSFWLSSYGLPSGAPTENTVGESFCQYVIRGAGELIVDDAATDGRTRDNPSVESMGVRAWAGVPLCAPGGAILGSFCVVDTVPRTWSTSEIEIIRALGDAAGREIALRMALAEERSLRKQLDLFATTLQTSLLPPRLPDVPGLDLAACFHAAESGAELIGDFYDVFTVRDGTLGFVVGDVAGKGVEAAKTAALVRYTVGAFALRTSDSTDVLEWLNETVLARKDVFELFVTVLYGVVTLEDGGATIRLASGGHIRPIVRRADGQAAAVDMSGGIIGMWEDPGIDETTVRLAPGDVLLAMTDGVNDSRHDRREFPEAAVLELIASAPLGADADTLARRIRDAAVQFADGTSSDDIAVLAIRFPSGR